MRDGRVLVVSSSYEGFCLASAEALSAGIPVVAYASSPGLSDQFRGDMRRGLVAVQDEQVLVARLAEIVQAPYVIPQEVVHDLSAEAMTKRFLDAVQVGA